MIAVVFRGEIAAREHQALLEAALDRDWKRAQAIMTSHIEGCVEHALKKEDSAGLLGGEARKAEASPGKRALAERKNRTRPARTRARA